VVTVSIVENKDRSSSFMPMIIRRNHDEVVSIVDCSCRHLNSQHLITHSRSNHELAIRDTVGRKLVSYSCLQGDGKTS
jgi:hypothetical protein